MANIDEKELKEENISAESKCSEENVDIQDNKDDEKEVKTMEDNISDCKEDEHNDKEDEHDDKEDIDYECKMAEYEAIISKMEEEKKVYMSELEALRKYKSEREEADKNFAIEEVFSQISEVMPQDKINELREEAKGVKFEAIDGFKNKVKAMAFEYTSNNKEIKSDRMAIVNIDTKISQRKSFDWYN